MSRCRHARTFSEIRVWRNRFYRVTVCRTCGAALAWAEIA